MISFLTRLVSSLVLLPVVCYAIVAGGLPYKVCLISWLCISVYEWFRLCVRSNLSALRSNIWFASGLIYILIAIWGFYQLRFMSQILDLPEYLMQIFLIILVATVDTSAYIIGKLCKGPKLAPAISPKKTWSGAMGAMAATVGFAYASLYYQYGSSYCADGLFCKIYIVICLCIAIVSQIGDLLESFAKRYFGVKDSGSIIPGHGGVLDRTDGILAVCFVLGCIFYFL